MLCQTACSAACFIVMTVTPSAPRAGADRETWRASSPALRRSVRSRARADRRCDRPGQCDHPAAVRATYADDRTRRPNAPPSPGRMREAARVELRRRLVEQFTLGARFGVHDVTLQADEHAVRRPVRAEADRLLAEGAGTVEIIGKDRRKLRGRTNHDPGGRLILMSHTVHPFVILITLLITASFRSFRRRGSEALDRHVHRQDPSKAPEGRFNGVLVCAESAQPTHIVEKFTLGVGE